MKLHGMKVTAEVFFLDVIRVVRSICRTDVKSLPLVYSIAGQSFLHRSKTTLDALPYIPRQEKMPQLSISNT